MREADLDLVALDRKLREAALHARRFRRTLRSAPDPAAVEPFALALAPELVPALASLTRADPLAAALLPWLWRLQGEQRFARTRRDLAVAWRCDEYPVERPESSRKTLAELLRSALRDRTWRPLYLENLARSASNVKERVGRLWEDRAEYARASDVDLDAVEVVAEGIFATARAWLGASDAVYAELRIRDTSQWLSASLAEEASEGWPAHLTPRAISELLSEVRWFDGLRMDPGELPTAYAASSFARALAQVGRAWRDAAANPQASFGLSCDIHGLERQLHGALFGLLPLSAVFVRRRLGLGSARVKDHLRVMARSVLVESRTLALRVLLRKPALAGRAHLEQAFGELGAQALGFELPSPLCGALPRLHTDDTARFAGLLLAENRAEELSRAHDEDWFRNPRAVEELRQRARDGSQARADGTPLESGAARLLKTLSAFA